jgi:hypothetical protein
MDALRTATLEFLDILQNSGRPVGDVLVGIVPFATGVRLDPAVYRNAPGFYSTGDAWSPQAAQWDGCVWDRNSPHDTRNTWPTDASHLFPRLACSQSNQSHLTYVRPMTSDFAALRQTINAMTPNGNTNVTIGVVWGWHLLSWNVAPPYPSPRAVPANTDRWLVVLTDGDNTQSRHSATQVDIDARTRQACDNIRAGDATIRVMTVRVIAGNADLLRSCATNSGYYYEVSDSTQLVDVFRRIAWEISALRLTQ